MQPTLKLLAAADIRAAENALGSNIREDKNIAAYHVQQAIEKIIKYEASKEDLNLWGHDISKLIMQSSNCNFYVPNEIKKNAHMYNNWEAISRYYPTFSVKRSSIEKAIRIVKEWMSKIN